MIEIQVQCESLFENVIHIKKQKVIALRILFATFAKMVVYINLLLFLFLAPNELQASKFYFHFKKMFVSNAFLKTHFVQCKAVTHFGAT